MFPFERALGSRMNRTGHTMRNVYILYSYIHNLCQQNVTTAVWKQNPMQEMLKPAPNRRNPSKNIDLLLLNRFDIVFTFKFFDYPIANACSLIEMLTIKFPI